MYYISTTTYPVQVIHTYNHFNMSVEKFSYLDKYPALERDDSVTTEANMDNIYRVIHLLSKGCGETPYNPEIWQSWENRQLDPPKTVSSIQVEKKVLDKDKKDTGQRKMVDQRLRKPTTFSALGKDAIKVIFIHLAAEAQAASEKIKNAHASQPNEIKNIIVEHARETSTINFSSLVYHACDKINDSVIMDVFPEDKNSYDHKTQAKLLNIVPNQITRSIVSGAFVKFQKLYDTFLATDLFSTALINAHKPVDTKPKTGRGKKTENGNDAKSGDDKESKGTSGKATSLKQLLHFIMHLNTLLPAQEKSPESIYPYLVQATFALGINMKNKPKIVKAKTAGKSTGKSSKKGKTLKEDLAKLDIENGVDDDDAKDAGTESDAGSDGSESDGSDSSGSSSDSDEDASDEEAKPKSKARGKGIKTETAPKRGRAANKK